MVGDGITDLEAVQESGGADMFVGFGGEPCHGLAVVVVPLGRPVHCPMQLHMLRLCRCALPKLNRVHTNRHCGAASCEGLC